MARSASHIIPGHQQESQMNVPTSPPRISPFTWQQQQQQYLPQAPQLSCIDDSLIPTTCASMTPTGVNYIPFDKYEEKRRSQCTDKKSNVLKLLKRASTFRDKSHPNNCATTLSACQTPTTSTDGTITNTEQADDVSPNTSTSSVLNPSSLFSNLTSPTSIVMTGYDTLTNLHNTIMNTAKSSFRTSPSLQGDDSSIHSASQSEYLHNTSSRKSSLQQPHFLYDVAWVDCLRNTNKFARDLLATEKLPNKTISDLSDMVHDFYQTMNTRFETQFVYKGATPDQLELLNDNMERILNEHIYQVISARIINEDEEHNMAIQKRIRSLNWITVEHLEIDIDFKHPLVHDLLDKAICQMVEMYSRTSSIDKLECIVQCSKTIFELLQVSPVSGHSVPVSADQFLPVLVFVVIQANPPMLPADMKYLTRFSNPRRLMTGETGYYFTNLCCALEFIEKVSGASLNISEDDFKKFVTGEAVPETKSQFNTYLCDGLRTMCSNDAALKKLRRANEARQAKIEYLSEQIGVHLETNRAKLLEMQSYANNLKQKLKPNLPKSFHNFVVENRESAIKLLPLYLRNSIEISLEPEEKLVEIETIEDVEPHSFPVVSDAIELTPVVLRPISIGHDSTQITNIDQSSSPVNQFDGTFSSTEKSKPLQTPKEPDEQ